jgi:hypothetical protein
VLLATEHPVKVFGWGFYYGPSPPTEHEGSVQNYVDDVMRNEKYMRDRLLYRTAVGSHNYDILN